MMYTTNQRLLVLLVLLGMVMSSGAWWLAPTVNTHYYCGRKLHERVKLHCNDLWHIGCCGKRKRSISEPGSKVEGSDEFIREEGAKAFLSAARHHRKKRSLNEECCHEGCQDEEIREIC